MSDLKNILRLNYSFLPRFIQFSLIINLILILLLISCTHQPSEYPISIKADKTQLAMGHPVRLEASIENYNAEQRVILLPYVNGKRWGSHEFPDLNGEASFVIPLPNPGPAMIQVIAVPAENESWLGLDARNPMLKAGSFMPEWDKKSNVVLVEVKHREVPRKPNGETLFGVQWEPWFIPGFSWETAQGAPVMGIYDSTDPDVMRQQILWFMDLGVDFIIPDWSNHMWGKKHWNERGAHADGIMHTTQLFLEVLADMRDQGLDVPKVALMPGLSNGPPTTMEGLNEQLEWIYQDYVRNPRFKDLWQIYDEKPLIIILDTGVVGHKEGTTESSFRVPFFKWTLTSGGQFDQQSIDSLRQKQGPVDDTHFTVRWMSSQNQVTRHHEAGYWSWMDGSLEPMVTYRDGKAEALTVTPAFFAEYGWIAPEAYGRRGGWTYIESFRSALEYRPQVVMLHQWNEYAGQKIGHGYGPDKNVFLDTYSTEFSDDLEPISPTLAGYRGNNPYGYYYFNLTRALMDIYRGDANDVTLLAVHVADSSGNGIKLEWTTAGLPPASYTVKVDGKTYMEETSETSCIIPKTMIGEGSHTISVIANGVSTRYELSKYKIDDILEEALPVIVEKTIIVDN